MLALALLLVLSCLPNEYEYYISLLSTITSAKIITSIIFAGTVPDFLIYRTQKLCTIVLLNYEYIEYIEYYLCSGRSIRTSTSSASLHILQYSV